MRGWHVDNNKWRLQGKRVECVGHVTAILIAASRGRSGELPMQQVLDAMKRSEIGRGEYPCRLGTYGDEPELKCVAQLWRFKVALSEGGQIDQCCTAMHGVRIENQADGIGGVWVADRGGGQSSGKNGGHLCLSTGDDVVLFEIFFGLLGSQVLTGGEIDHDAHHKILAVRSDVSDGLFGTFLEGDSGHAVGAMKDLGYTTAVGTGENLLQAGDPGRFGSGSQQGEVVMMAPSRGATQRLRNMPDSSYELCSSGRHTVLIMNGPVWSMPQQEWGAADVITGHPRGVGRCFGLDGRRDMGSRRGAAFFHGLIKVQFVRHKGMRGIFCQ